MKHPFLRLLLVVVLALLTTPAAAEDDGPRCTCKATKACFHYLRSPATVPYGPCACEKCEVKGRHDGKELPLGMNPSCFNNKKMACFLKRHSASWRLTCSACLDDTDCCNFEHAGNCPKCHATKSPWAKNAREKAAQQLAVEKKIFKKTKPIVVWSRRFYVVTDIKSIKIETQDAGRRIASGHEYAHLMLARCERAYQEFSKAFGGRVGQSRPMGVFLPSKQTTAERLQEQYFRNRRYPMIYSAYGSSSQSSIADGFCLNGLCVSPQRLGSDDHHVHESVRHFIGHILISVWLKRDGDNRTLPRWMFVGAGHWLGKRLPKLADKVWYCEGEAKKVGGSGKNWRKAVTDRAKKNGFGPISDLLAKGSLGQMQHRDHQRAWGYFEVCMEEWRKPFVAMLGDLRREVPVRDAFVKRLGMTPEQFHERWAARLTGRRQHMDPAKDKREVKTEDAPGPEALLAETDGKKLVIALRSLGTVRDVKLVRALLDLVAKWDEDRVRETVLELLRKSEGDDVQAEIWRYGLPHGHRMVRAYAARLVRSLELAGAKELNRKLLTDGFWLVRSEAALAAAAIQDWDAQARIREMCADPAPKARIGAMDALVSYGEAVNPRCVPVVAKNIEHADWQVRLATCDALTYVGDYRAVGPLVARWDKEKGRIGDAIYATLRDITDDDLGPKVKHWLDWWKRKEEEVARRKGFIKTKKPKDPTMGGRYAVPPPTYYGVELFSSRIGYVLDISRSTNRNFAASKSTLRKLPKDLAAKTVLEICQAEIVRSIRSLDPRTKFTVIAFGTDVFQWKNRLQVANGSNKGSAEGFVKSKNPVGETNFYGALRTVLDLKKTDVTSPGFRDTPDTMTFLTDGSPTVGEITDPDTLLGWYTELNRYARVRTHVIAFGTLGVDERLLRALAERNDGMFVQLFEMTR